MTVTPRSSCVEQSRDVERWVAHHGWNPNAFRVSEPGFDYLRIAPDGCVAYADTGDAWVAVGAPLVAPERLGHAARQFFDAARRARRRACFFGVERRFIEAAGRELRSILIGEQPIYDPSKWFAVALGSGRVRSQLRRAARKGVEVRLLSAPELQRAETRARLSRLAEAWSRGHGLAPFDFLLRVEPSTFSPQRRCFVATRGESWVGFASVAPVPARGGFFLDHLVRDRSAPNGTSELLIDAVMRWAAEQGSRWVTLGLSPLSGPVSAPLRLARERLRFCYDFEGIRSFREKLEPEAWLPVYVGYPATQGPLTTTLDALRAFTRNGLVWHGLVSLWRGLAERRSPRAIRSPSDTARRAP